jgi:hypothetical protein
MGDELVDVGEELPEVIRERRAQPVALAAAGDIDADDARIGGKLARDEVEVARVAAIAMRADDDARAVAPSPLGVMEGMEPGRPQRPVGMVPGLEALRFESIPRDRPLEEAVGFDGTAVAFGGEAVAEGGADIPETTAGRLDEVRDDVGEIHAALCLGTTHMRLHRGEFRVLCLEIHLKPPCGRSTGIRGASDRA